MYQDPYAVKALVQHEFDTDHINIWLTFPEPMNQKHKPLDTVWIVDVDGSTKSVTTSIWQDAYTLLLVVTSISSSPIRVRVQFDGPDSYLETTWLKNWEPWGYILSQDIGRLIETDPVAMAYLDQAVKVASSPEFASLTFGPNTLLTKYKIAPNTAAAMNALQIKALTAGQRCTVDMFAADHDGTDVCAFRIFGKIGAGGIDVDDERFMLRYTSTGCALFVTKNGAGMNQLPLAIFTGAYTTQLVLNIDGTISIGSILDVATGYRCGTTVGITGGPYVMGEKLTPGGNQSTITIKGGIITQCAPAT